jgi:hypothetical protein
MGHVNTAKCPLCGAPIEVPWAIDVERDTHVIDPGNLYIHLREAHPERWAEVCQAQRAVNALIDPVPRKIDGTLLLPGEDVGDILERHR